MAASEEDERILVHHGELFADVVTAGYVVVKEEEEAVPRRKTLAELRKDAMVEKRKQRDRRYRDDFERSQADRKRRMEETLAKQEDEGDALLESLEHERGTLLKEVDSYLELEEHTREQKKARLYQEWSDNVFDKIQSQISEVLDSVPVEEIARRRMELFDQFLHQTNTKAGLFRDIIIPAEYNPLAGRKHAVRYRTEELDDPVKKSLTRVAKERKNVGLMDEGERKEMLREMFDVKLWDKVESTPHGHYSKMFDAESKRGNRVPLPDAARRPDAQKCSVVLDHYNYDKTYNSVAAELPRGKRTFPEKM